ncbi:SusC/RagA family TonB-linked outer membrane protein [Fulvivirga sp. RKSG066]|uniref:SusC/RagA family TonB-linked outer membrane protein n=1 Tax=Fulvivirga aurantia TaxID=2529383 RepID=UPI0012BC3CD8|nr:SusC/RagA family TonB-linked outer membrane protein [Fulvivirga aurantia]MTI21455.1 SusC/RagA family TonB-linked outer membrane protein [Fulvivirga aurantia]
MKKLLLFFWFFSFAIFVMAQDRTITGKVTSSDDGSALPGVNVVLKGTTVGTVTDVEGDYRLSIPDEGGTLIFSFIGLETQQIDVGSRSVIDVAMASDVQQLSEVVVTAQGIERKKEALGFAVSTLDEDAVADKTEGDVVRSLRSKASGVQITQQSGLSGSGTNILIRGYTSFTGNNQPLFIIDGVPFNTNTNSADGDNDGGRDFVDGASSGSSRFVDLDPNNIESINILKGLAAATLYGTQGRNGVVLITTKSGASGTASKKMDISVSQSVFANKIASLPDYQDSFGNGFDQVFGWFFSNWGPGFYEEGLAGWANDSSIDENGNLPHPYSQYSNPALRAAFPQFQEGQPDHDYPWVPYDNVSEFFRTGIVSNTSVNARGVSDDGRSTYNLNFGYLNDEGFTPGNELERISFSVGGNTKLNNGLSINGTMTLSRTDWQSPPVSASEGNGAFDPDGNNPVSSSVFGHVFFTPRSIDLMNLPFENPIDGSSVYYRNGNDIQNPRWTVANAFNSQLTNRVFGTLGTSYDITENLNVAYRLGYDIYNERNESGQNKGGVEGPLTGLYRTFDNQNTIWDHTLTLNGDYNITELLRLNFNLGATSRRTVLDRQGVTSVNQVAFGTFRHFNFTDQSPIQYFEEQNIVGLFGQAEFDYNGYLFVTLAGRRDAVSNFSEDNRSLFYPSISTAVILSEILPSLTNNPNILNLLKIRAGFGTSAGFREGYPTVSVLSANSRKFLDPGGATISSNTTGSLLGNPDLKPERQEEFEVGLEIFGWNNRVDLDLSYYKRTSTDLIVQQPLDPSTGFLATFTNIGEVENKGIEIDLGVDIFANTAVKWNARANFTRIESEVIELSPGTDQIAIAGFSNLGNFAKVGEPLGVMLGNRIQRSPDGEFVLNSVGDYVIEQGTFKIGDPIPDFTLNVVNSVNYKNFTLSAVINWVQGGDIYSRTVSTLLGRGLTTDTEDRLGTFILPGVKNVGSNADPVYVENDLQTNNSSFYFDNVLFGPDELGVFDATTIRLQEISLSYALPKNILDKTPFGSVTLTASGFNLWYEAVNIPEGTNFDPNVAGLGVGNGQGFDYLNGPSSKRYGGTLKFTF